MGPGIAQILLDYLDVGSRSKNSDDDPYIHTGRSQCGFRNETAWGQASKGLVYPQGINISGGQSTFAGDDRERVVRSRIGGIISMPRGFGSVLPRIRASIARRGVVMTLFRSVLAPMQLAREYRAIAQKNIRQYRRGRNGCP